MKHYILIKNSSLHNSLTFQITRVFNPLRSQLQLHTMGLPTAHRVSHIVIKKCIVIASVSVAIYFVWIASLVSLARNDKFVARHGDDKFDFQISISNNKLKFTIKYLYKLITAGRQLLISVSIQPL